MSGRKDDEGKLRYDLLPRQALREVVSRLTFGAKKYEPDNWRKGIAYSRLVAAAERHWNAWLHGNITDADCDLHELSGVAINVLMLLEFEIENRREELNDVYCHQGAINQLQQTVQKIKSYNPNL